MLFRSDVLTGVLEERYADVNVEVQPELFGSQQNISLHIQNLCETESLQDLSFINNCSHNVGDFMFHARHIR